MLEGLEREETGKQEEKSGATGGPKSRFAGWLLCCYLCCSSLKREIEDGTEPRMTSVKRRKKADSEVLKLEKNEAENEMEN